MRPEEALAEARARAAARGAPVPDQPPPTGERATTVQLVAWAVVEPDLREVRSTRRLGAPITLVKRGLLRLLAQRDTQVLAAQNRFNLQVATVLAELAERVERLEADRSDGPAAPP